MAKNFNFTASTVTDDVMDKLISRIAALLRKAASSTFQEEKELYETKAYALMAKHRIERSAVDSLNDEIVDVALGDWRSSYARVCAQIGTAVAEAFGCQFYWRQRGVFYRVYACGFASDVERVRRLVAVLVPQALAESQTLPGNIYLSAQAVRRSYLIGFASGVQRRFEEAAERAATEDESERGADAAASTALVFVARELQVAEAVKDRKMKRNQAPEAVDFDAYHSGFESGKNSGREKLDAANETLALP
jgi:Protein of unknown function (DUF2786)